MLSEGDPRSLFLTHWVILILMQICRFSGPLELGSEMILKILGAFCLFLWHMLMCH